VFTSGNEFLDVLEGKDPELSNELRVGLSDVIPKAVAYRIIQPALKAELHTLLRCSEDKTERLLAELAIGELDLVVSDCPIPPDVKVRAFNHHLGSCAIHFMAERSLAKKLKRRFPASLEGAPIILPTPEAAVRRELERWFFTEGITPRCVGEFQDRALMKLVAREGHGIVPIPSAVAIDVSREFDLQTVGISESVREHFYLISVERRFKNPVVKALLEASHGLFRPAPLPK
jgi:LysR family transcriptional activator of nhaA